MNFNNFSIRTKLILLLSLSSVIALSISMITFSYSIFSSQKHDTIENLTQLARISSENITASLTFDDEMSAKSTLQHLSINKNIQMVIVYDSQNKLFASYVSPSNSFKFEKKLLNPLDKIEKYFDWKRISVIVPIILSEKIIGHLKIISDTEQLTLKIIQKLQMMILIGILTLMILVLLAFRVHKVFTRPIFDLINIMDSVAKSNRYDMNIEYENKDEFKHLYNGFSNMLSMVEAQNKKIAEIHQQTRDSIEYSAGIQKAILPKRENINNFFHDSFLLWEPKDTVGGDIYFFETLRHEDEALFMVIDCTGHGVPGAFVTMIVKAIEKEIVSKLIRSDFDINPAIIMNYFNKNMKKLLNQNDKNSKSNTGFDAGIIYINKREKILKFSGSQTPLFIVQDNKLQVIKGDKESVGYKKTDINYKYTEHIIDVSQSTRIYLTTDGYLDQTGGAKGFLYGKKRFSKLVTDTYTKSFTKQLEIFQKAFRAYKVGQETKDDGTLIAFHLNLGEINDR